MTCLVCSDFHRSGHEDISPLHRPSTKDDELRRRLAAAQNEVQAIFKDRKKYDEAMVEAVTGQRQSEVECHKFKISAATESSKRRTISTQLEEAEEDSAEKAM